MTIIALILVFSPAFFVFFYAFYKAYIYFDKKHKIGENVVKIIEPLVFPENEEDLLKIKEENEANDELAAVITAAVNSYIRTK